jgi:hypothetical protein
MNYNLKIHLKNHENERVANLQYEEKNSLKNDYQHNEDDDEQLDDNQEENQQQQQQHQNEFISLLSHVDDDELDDVEADDDEDIDDVDLTNQNFKLNNNNNINAFNYTSYSNHNNNNNSSIKITSNKDQINNLINTSSGIILDSDSLTNF